MGAEIAKWVFTRIIVIRHRTLTAFRRVITCTGILEFRPAASRRPSLYGRRLTSANLFPAQMKKNRQFVAALCLLIAAALPSWAQKGGPPDEPPEALGRADAEFLQAADEVLAEMSKLLSLPIREPLKKSVRSREEIRQFLLRQMREDKDDATRYADQKALEALGLIPKGYPLDQKLVALLTEQIAGRYDPKQRECFIADWTQPTEQRLIMAHELTHALQDQSFHVEKWEEEVNTNDDTQLRRAPCAK